MVEFHLTDVEFAQDGRREAIPLKGLSGLWKPFPVEYKRGKPKSHRADEVQLCAQAICLEEMLNVYIPSGALFYEETRRRSDVLFDADIRKQTEETARGVHDLLSSGITPEATFGKWCASCSLVDICKPKQITTRHSARLWLENQLDELMTDN